MPKETHCSREKTRVVPTTLHLGQFVKQIDLTFTSTRSTKEPLSVNPVRDGLFLGCSRMGGGAKRTPLPKICHAHATMMKRGTVIPCLRSQKYLNHVTHSMSSADISIFSPEISKFCYIKKYRYRLHFYTKFLILLTFIESLKIILINMVEILMMSAKMTIAGLGKIKVF